MTFLIIAVFLAMFFIIGWTQRNVKEIRFGPIVVRTKLSIADTRQFQENIEEAMRKMEEFKPAWDIRNIGPGPYEEIKGR